MYHVQILMPFQEKDTQRVRILNLFYGFTKFNL